MTASTEVQELLRELEPIYREVRGLLVERDELNSVEQARAAYQALLADIEGRIEEERRRSFAIETEIHRRKLRFDEEESEGALPPIFGPGSMRDGGSSGTRAGKTVERSMPARPADRAARSRLKKLVNRWAGAWRLEPEVQGRINRIADEADTPLGEALALLGWEVYADPDRSGEDPEEHSARLREWRDLLAEYRRQLVGDVEALKIRFGPALPIWEKWRERDGGPEGQRNWQVFIDDTRRAKLADLERLAAETRRLAQELGSLPDRSPRAGG